MAKFTFYCNTRISGSQVSETIDIPDDEIEGFTEDELEERLQEEYDVFMQNNVDSGWYREDE